MKIGRQLRLDIYGESHAPKIGMRLEGFPYGEVLDLEALREFLKRRAPGRDALSTARREPDEPEFSSGVVRDGGESGKFLTTGAPIEAFIRNTDTRSGDYERTIPRPGHADYPNWVTTGRIPPGGGANSGRMTAAMCIAGGLCLQALERRGIRVAASVEDAERVAAAATAAKAAGDSVGAVVACEVTGLPVGLGGAMFDGIDGAIAQALFGIPGVKGIEFGNGFRSATLLGSENNDPFAIRDGSVVTLSNNHGGVLGGMTSGMPLTLRLALKPTPSIYKEQQSVDLATMSETPLVVRGRHDPCIAFRAVPVVEALVAFAVFDAVLEREGTVVIGSGFAKEIASLGPCVIDSNVARLYPHLAKRAIYVIPSGEENKTIATVAALWEAFAKAGLGRKDSIVAIGGGVTGDLTGFAAATFMRGIDWINVPTSLLAMVDASYGGKTACDLPCGKNLAGAFHPPRRVIIDTDFLKTLPARELRCGRAEMIKHEVIGGLDHSCDVSLIPTADEIRRNLAVKIAIVRADPMERTGERMKLNAGHTVAHAIEKATNYGVSHGEAVAIGCVEEARIAARMGLASPAWPGELAARFAAAGLPTVLPEPLSLDSLASLMAGDKKRDGARVAFALPCSWGSVVASALDPAQLH